MRRPLRILAWTLGGLLLLPVLAVGGLLLALNIGPGRAAMEPLLVKVTGGQVAIEGLSGRVPDRLRLARLTVRDGQGVWLEARDLALDWSPLALLHGQALVHRLEAARLVMARLPTSEPGPTPAASDTKPFTLPVRVTLERLVVDRAELAAPVAGAAAVLALDGAADLPSLEAGTGRLAVRRLDAPGSYTLEATVDPARLNARLALEEPEGGLIARLASLPAIGAIRAAASVDGPRTALATTLDLAAGPLTATARGTVDLDGSRAALTLTADAPAMRPAEGVAWRSVGLQAKVEGPFTAPRATGTLRVDALEAGGAAVRAIAADLAGDAGQVTLSAAAEGVRIPGPDPALLEAEPLRLQATARLDDPSRPVRFSLAHPALSLSGTARTAGAISAEGTLDLPSLARFATLAGVALEGRATLALRGATGPGGTSIGLEGPLALTAGPAPAPALLGPDARIAIAARLQGNDVLLERAELTGAHVTLAASGTSRAGALDLTVRLGLPELALAAPALEGAATLDARIRGTPDALAVDATLAGDIGAPGIARSPVRLQAALMGLPAAPQGRITGGGTLLGAPLDLLIDAARTPDGTLTARIARADWRSLHAEGAVSLAPGATVPQGNLALRATRLDDLRPFVGQPLSGALEATATLGADEATLAATLREAGVPGSRVGLATLKAQVAHPLADPVVQATLTTTGLAAGGVTGALRLEAQGLQSALSLRSSGELVVGGTPVRYGTAAILNLPGKTLAVSALQATARPPGAAAEETVRLLAPATVRFAGGVAVDRLRLGARQATLEVAGRLSPTLDATVALRTPADIAALFDPAYAADGTVALDAKLQGSPAQPGGTVKLQATGVRLRTGPGRAAPPATVTANIQLRGGAAQVDARLAAGSAQLAVAGQAPLGAGALALRATGGLDLALLDPILNADGRRARGRLSIDAAVGGTVMAPRLSGTATLAGGEVQDFAQGFRLTDLAATLRLEGDTVRLASLTGRAGAGTLAGQGTIGALAPGLPIDLALTLRNARPLASDQVTADLDADLTVRGSVNAGLALGGRIGVRRAELRIPDALPASVPVLDVRRPGAKAPKPAAASAPIGLDLAIDAPGAVFVRGRGVDAEMGGTLRLRGTSAAPRVEGGLALRRGTISAAGTSLDFSRGRVGFDGVGLSGKIDPTLDFAADSTAGGVTATLAIGGYVSKPKITLSSVPELPQDEVLATLLFKRSAKELGPFQLASIAVALADLTGVGGGGLDPLGRVRKGLGLDRLSVGGGNGTTNTGPSVEAGRYVANGVYVGARQGTGSGAGTQATVQIDITRGLKVETDVGTGTGGNKLGLTYQFEY